MMERLLGSRSPLVLCLLTALASTGCNQRKCGPGTAPVGDDCRALPDGGGTGVADGATIDSGTGRDPVDGAMSGTPSSNSNAQDAQAVTGVGDAAAKPEPESCNFRDDDLDGLVDEGFAIAKLNAEAEQVFTQTSVAKPVAGQVALLERPEGGAWLFYREMEAFSEDVVRDIQAVLLDANGKYLPKAGDPRHVGVGATNWTAAVGDGYIGLVERLKGHGGAQTVLRLSLLSSSDLTEVEHIDLASPASGLDAQPMDVALFKDPDGTLHVAAGIAVQQSAGETPSWKATLELIDKSPRSLLSVVGQIELYSGSRPYFPFGPSHLQVERIPCRQEWMVVHLTAPNTFDMRRASLRGQWIGSSLGNLPGDIAWMKLNAGEPRCAEHETAPALLFGYATSDGSHVRVLDVDRATGEIKQLGTELSVPAAVGFFAREWRERWYYTTFYAAASPKFAQFYEFDPRSSAQLPRLIGLYTEASGANPGDLWGDFGEYFMLPQAADVAFTGSAFVVAYPRGGGEACNLDAMRAASPFDQAAPAAAVTYRIGCN